MAAGRWSRRAPGQRTPAPACRLVAAPPQRCLHHRLWPCLHYLAGEAIGLVRAGQGAEGVAPKAARGGRGRGAARAAAWPAALPKAGGEVAHGHWRDGNGDVPPLHMSAAGSEALPAARAGDCWGCSASFFFRLHPVIEYKDIFISMMSGALQHLYLGRAYPARRPSVRPGPPSAPDAHSLLHQNRWNHLGPDERAAPPRHQQEQFR